ncbi:MAG: ferrous iron transport protein A [Desulfovibrio sp.]|nr:MAG: ferrous iron transport protein A [Desulfovibrio sp.]
MRWKRRRKHGQGFTQETCAKDETPALNSLRTGSTAKVCGIRAGSNARSRLASLGLIPGSLLLVVANPGIGPLLLSVGESRLMVERGIATKVLVEQV